MPQALGGNARFAFVPEVTWGTTPGSPAMKLLKAATYGESLGLDIEKLLSNSINGNRSVEMVRQGSIDIKGTVPFEVAALGFGTLLKHVLGSNADTGAGPYTHTMKRGTLPAGLSIEKGFTDLTTPQYFVFRGCKMNAMSFNLAPTGLVTGSFDVIGKDYALNTTQLGVPTATTHTPFVEHEAVCQEGGSAATFLGMNLNITNEIDGTKACGSRFIASAAEGKGNTTGDVTLMFDGVTTMNKWLNETTSSLSVALTNGANSLTILLPKVVYHGDATPKIQTAKGVVLTLPFTAYYDSATELTDVKMTLINTEATI